MAVAAQPLHFPFQAKWNDQIPAPSNRTPCEAIWQVIRTILAICILPLAIAIAATVTILAKGDALLRAFAKKGVLPSAWLYPGQFKRQVSRAFKAGCFGPVTEINRWLRDRYTITQHQITTPDGVKLNGYFFKHKQNTPETVMFCHSNAAFTEQANYSWLIEKAVEKNRVCNFFAFDYRGVSLSKGSAENMRDLLVDCESAFQFARDVLHVPPPKMRWYGWSLGGALSANVKAIHPECDNRYVNESSLSSIRDVVKESTPKLLRPLLFWIPSKMERQGWGLEVPLKKIKGEMMIVYRKKDLIIPYPSSAHATAFKANLVFQSIELSQTPEQIEETRGQDIDIHSEPLCNFVTQDGQPAEDVIAEFILPPASIS
ncbi:MAG TPA: alpha/beta hydrolase [Chlamydiales bacterium]|nr:alpha/beta hydrolase [Chlamydiales bacterium]